MSLPRQIVAGRTYLVTRRCTQRQFWLRPDEQVERIFLYCLAEAAARYGITLHGWIAMSNHLHLVIRDNRGNLPQFLCHFHKMLAKALNVRWRRRENLFAVEPASAVHLVEAADRFDKLIYLLTNPVIDHLVDRVANWPGACALAQLLSGEPKTVKRPHAFFALDGRMPDEVTLRIERLEGFEHLSHEEWAAAVLRAVVEREGDADAQRLRDGRSIVGRKAILCMSPGARPETVEPARSLRPTVACMDKVRRILELRLVRAFRVAYREALRLLRAGVNDVIFPFGTYALRALGVRCAESPPC